MSDEPQSEDAWLLLAILYAAQANEPVNLVRLIGSADFINHAIPTLGELEGALGRLSDRGWILVDKLEFSPTPQAEEMFGPRRGIRTAVPSDLEFVREEIGAAVWSADATLTETPDRPCIKGLTASALDDAFQQYSASLRAHR